jgi:putative ABC transport system ATP-binding protein
MKNITIQCTDITKSFKSGEHEIQVLKGINLEVQAGEMLMLMGPSGSGKTTLLTIIAGIMAPTMGTCLILDRNMYTMPSDELTLFRGKTIGLLFQKFMLVPTLNAIENAAITLLCQGVDDKIAFEKAAVLLGQLGLKNLLYAMPQELSGGEQQRVALARAVIHDPPVILCDEPTSFLDSELGQQIMELLKGIQKKSGATVVVVTHDDRILAFADRIVEIEDGQLKDGVKKNQQQSSAESAELPMVIT